MNGFKRLISAISSFACQHDELRVLDIKDVMFSTRAKEEIDERTGDYPR